MEISLEQLYQHMTKGGVENQSLIYVFDKFKFPKLIVENATPEEMTDRLQQCKEIVKAWGLKKDGWSFFSIPTENNMHIYCEDETQLTRLRLEL